MAFGKTLQDARKARSLTASQVAAATNIKVQIIEDLESEDLKRIPAAIYGKGFIKLYAEHVGLDVQPLLEDYVAVLAGTEPVEPAPLLTAAVQQRLESEAVVDVAAAAPAAGEPSAAAGDGDLFQYGEKREAQTASSHGAYAPADGDGDGGGEPPWIRLLDRLADLLGGSRTAAIAVSSAAAVVLLIMIIIAANSCGAPRTGGVTDPVPPVTTTTGSETTPTAAVPAPSADGLRLVEEPPPAWFD